MVINGKVQEGDSRDKGRNKAVWSFLHCVEQSRGNSVMSKEK